ncbi:copper chaperone, partial [Patescibacteria group bacterium]
MLTKKIYIQGMHCVSCEKLLNDEFRTVTGVKDVKVDRKANVAEIFYEDQAPDFAALKSVAKKFGYDAFESQPKIAQKKINWPEWGKALGITALLLIAYR